MATHDRHAQTHAAVFLQKVLGDKKDSRILDVAAGTGISGQSVSY